MFKNVMIHFFFSFIPVMMRSSHFLNIRSLLTIPQCLVSFQKAFNIKLVLVSTHYANMSVQYTAIFHGCKNFNFQMKIFDIFLIFAQNIDCGYTLEPPQRGGSNEYPQSMFRSKNKKNMYTRVNPTFSI